MRKPQRKGDANARSLWKANGKEEDSDQGKKEKDAEVIHDEKEKVTCQRNVSPSVYAKSIKARKADLLLKDALTTTGRLAVISKRHSPAVVRGRGLSVRV